MAKPQGVTRRDFLLLRARSGVRVVSLSCGELYVRYLDAESRSTRERRPGAERWHPAPGEPSPVVTEPSFAEVVGDVAGRLDHADTIVVSGVEWLQDPSFREEIDRLLAPVLARGTPVVYEP